MSTSVIEFPISYPGPGLCNKRHAHTRLVLILVFFRLPKSRFSSVLVLDPTFQGTIADTLGSGTGRWISNFRNGIALDLNSTPRPLAWGLLPTERLPSRLDTRSESSLERLSAPSPRVSAARSWLRDAVG